MPATSDPPHSDWPVGPSRGAALAVAVVTLLGSLGAFANGLPAFLQVLVLLLVLGGGGIAIARLLRPPLDGLRIDERGVHVRRSGEPSRLARPVGAPFVSPLYVGFRCRWAGRKLPHSVGVFRGQMSEGDFRRLCAALRQRGEE